MNPCDVDPTRRGAFTWKPILVAVLLLAGTIAGCAEKKPPPPAAKPPEVLVKKAVLRDVLDYEEFTGRTAAYKNVVIRARVTGYLDKIFFRDGQEVKENDPLFQIDPRLLTAEKNAAEATVFQAEAHLKRLDDDYRRAQTVLAKNAISREDFDKIAGDRAEADAAVKVARAQRDRARVNLDYAFIRSPLTGRISRANMDPHNLVRADETELTTIVALDPAYAYFDVDERTHLRVQEMKRKKVFLSESEAPIQVGLADEDGYPHQGVINFEDNQLDVGTGTKRFRCEIPNPDRRFEPGMFLRIKLPIGMPVSCVMVPEEAIGTDQGQKFLYVVDENDDVSYRAVKVGSMHNGWRVIHQDKNSTKSVAAGERIVVSGLQRVRPGIRVNPKEEDAAKNK